MDEAALQAIPNEALGCVDQLQNDVLSDPTSLSFAPGISLLTLKSHVLLSYLHHLSLLCAQRLQGASFVPGEGEDVKTTVEELVWARLVTERIRPMQGKLRHQIEKLTTKAEEAEARGGDLDDEEPIQEPMHFGPDPTASLSQMARQGPSSDVEDDFEAEASTSLGKGKDRLPPTETKKKRSAPAPLAVRDSIALPRSVPHSESTSGLGVSSLSTSARAKHLSRIAAYEEDNLMRVFGTKKELKRRRMDEEDVALGGQGVTSRDPKGRRRGGLESEFADLLGGNDTARKGKLRRTKEGDLDDGRKKSTKDPYASLREQGKAKKARFADAGSADVGATGKRKKGAFERAVKRSGLASTR